MNRLKNIDFFNLENTIWLAHKPLNIPAYDFKFEPLFETSRPRITETVATIARIGAIEDYTLLYNTFLNYGFQLINSPEQHRLASELEYWYPLIKDLTPKSKVYAEFPSLAVFEKDFSFPVFIKGNRQTAKHNPTLAIAKNAKDFIRIKEAYKNDPILHWQKVVFRTFETLQPMNFEAEDKVQISFEFRTFWWKKELIATGHYWSQYLDYTWTIEQENEALAIAQKAAQILDVPFLAIDVALTSTGKWIIIECNDAQESGYCGAKPMLLWKKILEKEQCL